MPGKEALQDTRQERKTRNASRIRKKARDAALAGIPSAPGGGGYHAAADSRAGVALIVPPLTVATVRKRKTQKN